ncbi:MAG: hypothetical protein NTX48_07165 [Planctomycetales bacterium]|nr:hypothetical protein [Planctomycetales bacterium]
MKYFFAVFMPIAICAFIELLLNPESIIFAAVCGGIGMVMYGCAFVVDRTMGTSIVFRGAIGALMLGLAFSFWLFATREGASMIAAIGIHISVGFAVASLCFLLITPHASSD